MIEISLILVLIAIVAIVVLTLLGGRISNTFSCVVHNLQGQTCTSSQIASPGNPGAGATYAAAVQADNPVAYWKLDDSGTSIADAVGAHTGTLSGSATEGLPGALGGGTDKAIDFDGSSASIVANASGLGFTWTLEAWLKTSALADGHIVEMAPVAFQVMADGNLEVAVTGVGTVTTTVASPGVADGAWHQVVVTDDGGTVTLYVDGHLRTSSPTLDGSAALTGSQIYIGRSFGGGGYFNGALDEVAVYNTVLSPARILAHFTAAS
jgi:Flp pilus assembly pilin Flp